jgi:hypothetical protein
MKKKLAPGTFLIATITGCVVGVIVLWITW